MTLKPMPPLVPTNSPAHIALENLAAYAIEAKGSYSPNTEAARRSDTNVLARWGIATGERTFPCEPETVARYLTEQSETKTVSTLQRYVASIRHMHDAAGLPDPCDSDKVKLTMLRITREKGSISKQAKALTRDLIDTMLATSPTTVTGLRDAALLAMAYDTGCRRSELVAFDVSDIDTELDGTGTVLIRRSKTDQDGKGDLVFLSRDTIVRLKAWCDAGKVTSGPLFRSVRRGGHPTTERLLPKNVRLIFIAMAKQAGIDPDGISGHSTRIGLAQDAAALGCSLAEIMQAGRWTTAEMVARYTRKIAVKRGASAKLAAARGDQ